MRLHETIRSILDSSEDKIYVRAFVPDYAWDDVTLNNYSPYYVGHADDAMLTDEALQGLVKEMDDPTDADSIFIDRFAALLEERGYIVFQSSFAGNIAIIEPQESANAGNDDPDENDPVKGDNHE